MSGRRRRRCWRVGFAHPAVRRRRKYRLYLGTEMKLSARTRNRQIFVAGMVLEHGYGSGAETRGAILDIIVDLRPESATYLEHISVELDEENQRSLYVPERFAHGYQALRDNTDTSYQVGEFYTPSAEGGLLHNDPRLKLQWPLPVAVISDKDLKFPLMDEVEPELKRRMTI